MSVQTPVPAQAPLQPVNVEPLAAVAVKVTAVVAGYVAVHVGPQLMPAGVPTTLPLPVPPRLTVIVLGFAVNVAVTLADPSPARVQIPVPVHSPLHPANVEPLAAVAVNVTGVVAGYVAVHVAPQSMPAGALTTLPLPAPPRLTVIVLGFAVNVAVTPTTVFPATVQVPVPVQPPLQPVNVDPLAAVAVNVTDVPTA